MKDFRKSSDNDEELLVEYYEAKSEYEAFRKTSPKSSFDRECIMIAKDTYDKIYRKVKAKGLI